MWMKRWNIILSLLTIYLIISIGGNLGLFLGWSLKSVVLDFIEFLYLRIRDVVPGGAGGAMAPPDFGRSVNPISTRGTDYAHLTTTSSLGFPDHPTALRMEKKSTMHCNIVQEFKRM